MRGISWDCTGLHGVWGLLHLNCTGLRGPALRGITRGLRDLGSAAFGPHGLHGIWGLPRTGCAGSGVCPA